MTLLIWIAYFWFEEPEVEPREPVTAEYNLVLPAGMGPSKAH
jgi:hypothetical protein